MPRPTTAIIIIIIIIIITILLTFTASLVPDEMVRSTSTNSRVTVESRLNTEITEWRQDQTRTF